MAEAKKLKVLIAEDESHSRLFLKAIVTSMNCEVVGEACTGVEAIELYRQLKPHMLLLDINLPNKTGEDVLREIRAEFPRALIIVVTSVSDQETVEKCLDLGAANYIRKDTPIAEIKLAIKETWGSHVANLRAKTPASSNDAH
ncbi:MAG TPA: two-component system response regulator [Syntrophobacteraceae bacterium]|jgi:two-component system, chemotaxis family, chemotaxis protein CheY|nr:two-component system response regulator [Syntrophobacteraceae bacterium]HBD08882.1 two-component system response regulator [Syntrophobacteraceae bacterium]HBZ56397.1 two-component system response regulator [Syntrophobacteraceae bacterium]